MSDDGDYDVDAGDFDGDDIADDIDEAGGVAGSWSTRFLDS